MDEVARLQRQNRLLTGALVLMTGVLIGSVLVPRHSPPPQPVVLLPALPAPTSSVSPSAQPMASATATEGVSSLVPDTGHVHLTLVPYTRGTVLRIDGRAVHGTDVDLPPGTHRVSLQGPEVVPVQTQVTARAGQSQAVTLKVLRLANLVVRAEPSGAQVVVWGPVRFRSAGPAPLVLNRLRPGRYRVEVTRRGCEGLVMEFHLPPGSRLEKMAELPELPPAALVMPHGALRPHPAPSPEDVPGPRATEVEDDTEPCPVPESPGVTVPGVKATPQ